MAQRFEFYSCTNYHVVVGTDLDFGAERPVLLMNVTAIELISSTTQSWFLNIHHLGATSRDRYIVRNEKMVAILW